MAISKPKFSRRLANPIETASGLGGDFVAQATSSVKNEVKSQFDGTGEDFFAQLLGLDLGSSKEKSRKNSRISGDMKPGEEITLTEFTFAARSQVEKYKRAENKPAVLAGIDYRSEILHGNERLSKRESRELERRILDITEELKRLVSSSQILSMEFAQVSVSTPPKKPGKYHMNFFEWLLLEIRRIRMKVEDSGAWLSVMKNKRSQRKYGVLAKKHGTKYTLSQERTVATQSG
jgi:hypothetical protein